MLWRPFCPPFCLHETDMSEINFIMLNRFLDLKNLYVATKIMCLAQILKKILRILSFGGHLGRHLEYFNFPNDAKVASFSFNVRTYWRTHLMQKHFVRTIFLGCTQNLHLATRLSYTYHYYTSIDKLRHQSLYTSSCRRTELKTMLSSYFYDVKMRVKQL